MSLIKKSGKASLENSSHYDFMR